MDETHKNCLLTINGGSSSVKYALYEMEGSLHPLLAGELVNIGSDKAKHNITLGKAQNHEPTINAQNNTETVECLVSWLGKELAYIHLKSIGHRIVHGMNYTSPELITNKLIKELKQIMAYDPEHLPIEISLIEAFIAQFPGVKQIACFDTSFHATMPGIAKLLPIPRKYRAKGIKRYGFHGLSYAYLLDEFERLAGVEASKGKIIMAHLGSGASLAAIKNGKSMDTTMGFSPASGLPMSTRTGDLDPGVSWYLMKSEKFTPREFNHLVNHESGLLGISETTPDMQELLKIQLDDTRAAEAVAFFCYQTIKWIGAFAAVLGGLDTLIFSGGIGAHSHEIRERICKGLQFLGIEINENKNKNNEKFISGPTSRVTTCAIRTNEELMIAKSVRIILNHKIKKQK